MKHMMKYIDLVRMDAGFWMDIANVMERRHLDGSNDAVMRELIYEMYRAQ